MIEEKPKTNAKKSHPKSKKAESVPAVAATVTPVDVVEKQNDADGADYVVPGLERGLRILSAFSSREPELGAPELSKRIGIPRTTTFRLIQTLEKLGFLERGSSDRTYRLSVAVLRLGFEYINSLELTDLAPAILEPLRDRTHFSAHLVVRDEQFVVFVAKAQSQESGYFSMKVNVGTRLPAHATVHGHVLMGNMTLEELRALYPERQLERMTEQTPATVDELHKRIKAIAKQGYALSQGSFEQGISVISAPVRNMSGRIVAAVSITIPRPDIGSPEKQTELIQAVCSAAREFSERLNFPRA